MKVKHLLLFYVLLNTVVTSYSQGGVRVIDNKGTINIADATNDSFSDNIANNKVELISKTNGTVRSAGTEFVIQDNGNVGIGVPNPVATLHNNGSIINTFRTLPNVATDGNIATAVTTVDIGSIFAIPQSTANLTLTLPGPTDTTAGLLIKIVNTGTQNFAMHGILMMPNSFSEFVWTGTAWIPILTPPSNITSTISNTITVGHKIADYKNEANVTVPINETITSIVQNNATGHKIAEYKNEANVTVPINETITGISQSNVTGTITYLNENGTKDEVVNNGDLLNVVSTDANNSITVGANGGAHYAAYEKVVIWAEESGGLSDNNGEWSFGNGAKGNIGIPLPEEWEAYAVSFNADNTSNDSNSVMIGVMDRVTGNQLFSFTATGANDNMVYTEILNTPVTITAGSCIGFRTIDEIGTILDARVAVWLRRRP